MKNSSASDIAIIGLGVMGKSLTLNLLENSFRVSGYDANEATKNRTAQAIAGEGDFAQRYQDCSDLKALMDSLNTPRILALSVPAGKIVDQVIDQLLAHGLQADDIVIDTGNSLWTDSIERTELYRGRCKFFTTAVSGGEQGARFGPSLMASGDADVWQRVMPMWHAIAAKIDPQGQALPALAQGEPCAAYIGPAGSGHFVKMVHNGIEYADMQLICEAYQLLKDIGGLTSAEIGRVFARWNDGVLNSYLIEISADILQQTDPASGKPLVEMIRDKAGQKGTGLWTATHAMESGCPAPTIVQAVISRASSAQATLRQSLASLYPAASRSQDSSEAFVNAVHDALYCAKICAYAQGFSLMALTAREQNWSLNFAEIARIWRGGCIVRAAFLQSIAVAFDRQPSLDNLLSDDFFRTEINQRQTQWRFVASQICQQAVSAPATLSALSYFDAMTEAVSSANLLQAQRDYFGAHSYQRIDQAEEKSYHFNWSDAQRTETELG
jgi:6-phosphogluconate dehydrogenase